MSHYLFFGQDFSSYKWKNRILLIEAADATDTDLVAQINYFKNLGSEFTDRKLLIFRKIKKEFSQLNVNTLQTESVSTQQYETSNHSFKLNLIGLDGTVKLAREKPVKPDEVFDLIDSMPMRRAELRNKN